MHPASDQRSLEEQSIKRAMPQRLILIRHGESEQNVINRLVKKGELPDYPPGFSSIPDREFRLSVQGRTQALQTGAWLKTAHPSTPEIIYASDHIRAQETAALVCKGAGWSDAKIRIDPLLGERNWGSWAAQPTHVRNEILSNAKRDPLNHSMPDGETMLATRWRSRELLDRCARQFGGKNVLVFSHGEYIKAVWSEIAHMSTEKQLEFFHSPQGEIHNCQVVEFSSEAPTSGQNNGKLQWVRSSCPSAQISGEWKVIERAVLTPDEILSKLDRYPPMQSLTPQVPPQDGGILRMPRI
jgi:broad specificity phosphatase PhoE